MSATSPTSPSVLQSFENAAAVDRPMDLTELVALFRKRFYLFCGVAAALTLLAIAAALVATPIYSAVAQIRIDPNQRKLLDTQAAFGAPPDQALVDTEVAVMRSPEVAQGVVDRLDLTHDPEFAPRARNRLLGGGAPSTASPDAVRLATATTLMRHLKIGREGVTYIVDVSALSKDPIMAARIANAVVEEYRLTSVRVGADAASSQGAWLGQRLQALGAEVQQADARLSNYKAQAGIVTGGGGATVTDQQIAPLSSELATAKSEAAAARSTLAAARALVATGNLQSVSGVLTSPTIAELRKQRAEVLRSQAEIDSRYGPKHPEAIRVRQQLDSLDQQMRDEGARIVSGLQSAADAAEARAASLQGGVSQLKAQQAGNNRASVEADSLQRDADAKRAIYAQLSQAAQQTDQRQHLNETAGKLIAAASPPVAAAFPNLVLFAGLGLVAGAIGGVAAIFVAEAFDFGMRSAEEVHQGLGVPLVATVPLLTASQLHAADGRRIEAADFVIQKPLSLFAEGFRAIRSVLTLPGNAPAPRVVAVTSALPGEGKTNCVVSLARVTGAGGGRVLVVDCDLRRQALAEVMNLPEPRVGLVEVLRGSVPLKEALVADQAAGVDVLPLHRTTGAADDLFATPAMRELLAELRGRYDLVLLDCPPVLALADARVLAALADGVLLIARWGRTPRHAARAAIVQLQSDGSNILGVVLNRAELGRRAALTRSTPGYYAGAFKGYYRD